MMIIVMIIMIMMLMIVIDGDNYGDWKPCRCQFANLNTIKLNQVKIINYLIIWFY